MMLTDTFGWVKRNIRKMNDQEKLRTLNEIKQIQLLLEKEMKRRVS